MIGSVEDSGSIPRHSCYCRGVDSSGHDPHADNQKWGVADPHKTAPRPSLLFMHVVCCVDQPVEGRWRTAARVPGGPVAAARQRAAGGNSPSLPGNWRSGTARTSGKPLATSPLPRCGTSVVCEETLSGQQFTTVKKNLVVLRVETHPPNAPPIRPILIVPVAKMEKR